MRFDISGNGDVENPQDAEGEAQTHEREQSTFESIKVKTNNLAQNPEAFKQFWEEDGEPIESLSEAMDYLESEVKGRERFEAFYDKKLTEALAEVIEQREEGEHDGDSSDSNGDNADSDGDNINDSVGSSDSSEQKKDGTSEGEEQPEDADGDSEESENPQGTDESSEGEGEGEGEGEQNPELEHRVAELERWRGEDVDPKLFTKTELPTPESGVLGGDMVDASEYGWLPEDALLDVLLERKTPKQEQQEDSQEETLPEWFDKAVALAKNGMSMLWVGPSGCGKTHTASLLAKHLGLPFGMEACSESSHDGNLKGLLVPVEAGGSFVHLPSLFLDMCTNPGVFLWDELDGADPNWLVGFNSMLAQRELFIPSRRLQTLPELELEDVLKYWTDRFGKEKIEAKIGKETIRSLRDLKAMLGTEAYKKLDNSFSHIKLHKDFIILGAANTFGHGADMVYAGRNQLDGATLDRFRMGTMYMTYSEKVERAILSPKVYQWGYLMRKALENLRLSRRLLTTRFLKDMETMTKAGWKISDCSDQYFMDFSEDEKLKVRREYENLMMAELKGEG